MCFARRLFVSSLDREILFKTQFSYDAIFRRVLQGVSLRFRSVNPIHFPLHIPSLLIRRMSNLAAPSTTKWRDVRFSNLHCCSRACCPVIHMDANVCSFPKDVLAVFSFAMSTRIMKYEIHHIRTVKICYLLELINRFDLTFIIQLTKLLFHTARVKEDLKYNIVY